MKNTVRMVGVASLIAWAPLLTACNQHASAASGALTADGKYCAPFSTTAATGPGARSDPAAAFDDCVHRWGYALAPSRDPADVVAQATVSACGPILSQWSQQVMGSDQGAAPESRRAQAEAASNPMAQQIRMAESRALFYVVQARAGGCAPPPANTLSSTS
ncbi:MAG TPA: hypothetical protein VME40_12560 [Caulobacteraceae bacterium]|nr:hypothetical protein [Caulobacteraceae bacterium]